MSLLNKILNKILDWLFPERCLVCRKGEALICSSCLRSIPVAERPTEPWIHPVFDYRNETIKRAVWLFKYKGRRQLAGLVAPLLYELLLEEMADLKAFHNFADPVLIPIPMSPKKIRTRGYNQAEILARELAALGEDLNLELFSDVLLKIKETPSQAKTKNKKERLENLKDSFSIKNPEKIQGRNVILVDDIITTGATLNEARKVLKNAGARKIIAIAAAH